MTDKKPLSPVYSSFLTFRNFIESLHSTACPPQIDRSVMTGISGGNQGALLATLKFLHLIDHAGQVTDRMQRLVKNFGSEKKWPEELAEVVFDAYVPIVGDLDLDNGTFQQLKDAFKKKGNVDGQVLDKAIRFYLRALGEAGITFSPHFRPPRGALSSSGRSSNGRSPKKAQANKKAKKRVSRRQFDDGRTPTEEECPEGCIPMPLHMPGKAKGMVYVPEDLDEADCDMIDAILRAYAKRRASK